MTISISSAKQLGRAGTKPGAFWYLKKPVQRLTVPNVYVPFSPTLEAEICPAKM